MDVTLSPDLEKFVQEKIASGRFHSATEIVNESLRLLQQQDQHPREEIRRKIAEAREELKDGKGLTPEELERNLTDRKAKWKAEHGLV